jgi:hypothetical protein
MGLIPRGPQEALFYFMDCSEAWMCRTVALAHPKEAFEFSDAHVPALWLSSKKRFPHFAQSLLSTMEPVEKERALRHCAQSLAFKALSRIHVCMEFRQRAPERCDERRCRKEHKLAKAIARLLRASCDERFGLNQARLASLEGIELGIADFMGRNPSCSRWVAGLAWASLAERAMAQAEANILRSIHGETEARASEKSSVSRL